MTFVYELEPCPLEIKIIIIITMTMFMVLSNHDAVIARVHPVHLMNED